MAVSKYFILFWFPWYFEIFIEVFFFFKNRRTWIIQVYGIKSFNFLMTFLGLCFTWWSFRRKFSRWKYRNVILNLLTVCWKKTNAINIEKNKTGVINDPLGRQWLSLDCEVLGRTDGRTDRRTLCVRIVITTGRDCGRPRGSIYRGPFKHTLCSVYHESFFCTLLYDLRTFKFFLGIFKNQ